MRLGSLIAVPNEYSNFGRISDGRGISYTVDAGDIPPDAEVGDELAYKVEIWGNDSGLAYHLEET